MNKKQSLADKISNILSTTPASFDPDGNNEETAAKITEGALEGDHDADDGLLSEFRKKNVEILEEIDSKYAGKKGSRNNFKDSEDEWETEEENDFKGASTSETDDSENDENEEGESFDDEVDEEQTEDEAGMSEEVEEDSFQHIKEDSIPNQVKKGLCVRNQLSIWENLLEMRIQMQKCLIPANKMPQKDYYKTLLDESGDDFKNKVKETKTTLSDTLNKLLELQMLLWRKYPETKNLLKTNLDKKEKEKVESDEEIPSDSDDQDAEQEDEPNNDKQPNKKLKLMDFEKDLSERHSQYKDYRNLIIQKWNDKTRIGSSKSNLQHSVLSQIDHILTDRSRLIKRTQTKRSNYDIIGVKQVEEESEESKLPLEYNSEIFDDDDFYHQLLRDLIEVKSADVTDPVQLGRQWVQLQNLRSKMKRKVDTRATKGRKIRYTVHAKLVNFMAPIDEGTYTEEAKTELFSSLCGKNQPVHRF